MATNKKAVDTNVDPEDAFFFKAHVANDPKKKAEWEKAMADRKKATKKTTSKKK